MRENLLQFDQQTLKDLNFSPYHCEGKAVFELLGKPRSLGGQSCLMELLRHPSTDVKWICERQKTIRFFQRSAINLPLPLADLDQIEHYIKSNINPVTSANLAGRLVQGINYRLNDSGSHFFLLRGIKQLVCFFRILEEFIKRFCDQELPGELAKIIHQLTEYLHANICRELCSTNPKRLTLPKVYRLDQWVRLESLPLIRSILDEIYQLDAFHTLAKATKSLEWNFPEIIEKQQPQLHLRELYHPLLQEPVPNDFTLGKNHHLLFLTGPNMAGKTTFLKALGISVYLAQLGLPVHAKKMRLTPFQSLITSIHTRDRLDKGYSYFFSEVQRVKDAVLTLNKSSHVLLIFDELFKGTNVEDAYEASARIISGFAKRPNNRFVLSSHLLELAPKLESLPGIEFQHFESTVENGKPLFSYKIKNGVSTQRLGMLILKNEGILNILEESPVLS